MGQPFSTVKHIPVTQYGVTEVMPFLFHEKAILGEASFCREALAWANASKLSYSSSKISASINALSRFANFLHAVRTEEAVLSDQLDTLVFAFLSTRLSGSIDEHGKCHLGGLCWKPAKIGTVRQDFDALLRYFQFCEVNFGYIALARKFSIHREKNPVENLRRMEKKKERDFLVHLNAAREYWKELAGDLNSIPPPIGRIANASSYRVRPFPPTDEIVEIIRGTDNPVYRAIWLVAAFGGLRISEILNTWSDDVLPYTYRSYFFPETSVNENHEILYLRAHPELSTYCGKISDETQNRRQFLHNQYGLQPRCSLHSTEPLYAGWKGTQVSGARECHQVYWVDPTAAKEFEKCYFQIQAFLKDLKTYRRHPYLYVNWGKKVCQFIGQPVKIKAAENAFRRACQRVGVTPNKFGRNLHGLRHHYKWYAEKQLGISPQYLQIMMGHASIESQNTYGRDARDLNQKLSRITAQRNRQVWEV